VRFSGCHWYNVLKNNFIITKLTFKDVRPVFTPICFVGDSCRETVTRLVPLVEQELLTLLEHHSSPRAHVARSLFFCVVFYRSWFVPLSFLCRPWYSYSLSFFDLIYDFFWPLCCLFFFDIRILIAPLVSSNSSNYAFWYLQTIIAISADFTAPGMYSMYLSIFRTLCLSLCDLVHCYYYAIIMKNNNNFYLTVNKMTM